MEFSKPCGSHNSFVINILESLETVGCHWSMNIHSLVLFMLTYDLRLFWSQPVIEISHWSKCCVFFCLFFFFQQCVKFDGVNMTSRRCLVSFHVASLCLNLPLSHPSTHLRWFLRQLWHRDQSMYQIKIMGCGHSLAFGALLCAALVVKKNLSLSFSPTAQCVH